jgi:transposase InsO family protein
LGPKRVSSELAREKWGGIVVSANGVWKVLCRHGLNTRAKRLGLIAGYAAPYEAPRDPGPEAHIDVDRPGELVGIDCFYVGRLRGTNGAIWHLTAIDVCSSYAWAELVVEKAHTVSAASTSRFARRVAAELKAAGWQLERFISDNGNEFKGTFATTAAQLQITQTRIHAGRPQTNGHVEALSQDHPRRVLAPSVCPLPLPDPQRPAPRAQYLLALLQHRPRPSRPADPRAHPRRHRLRCPQDGGQMTPQDGGQMSRGRRHISESAHPKAGWARSRAAPRT